MAVSTHNLIIGRFAVNVLAIIVGCNCAGAIVAQPFPVKPSLPLATGAFVQLNYGLASKSVNWWNTELAAMKAIGLDTVIVQYVAYNQSYYYPTSVAGGTPHAVDSVERVLDAADARGMNVYLGMHLDSGQFSGSFDLAANLAQGTATLNELNARYGTHASLAGWYMPQEFSDYIVFSEPTLRDNLVSYTHDLTALAHSATSRPMMISPYFGQNPNGPAYAAWWDATGLPDTGIDILALQDGIGTHRTTIAQSQAVYQALAPVLAAHDVEFWANNESFNQIHGWPVDNQGFAAIPTDINTFVEQLVSTAPTVAKSVTFEYATYLSTQGTAAANVLHQNYANYYTEVIAATWGDYDRSGFVDTADFDLWKSLFGQSSDLAADGNSDGVVDLADYTVWRDNVGAGSGNAATAIAAVPEPNLFPLALGAVWLLTVLSWPVPRHTARSPRIGGQA